MWGGELCIRKVKLIHKRCHCLSTWDVFLLDRVAYVMRCCTLLPVAFLGGRGGGTRHPLLMSYLENCVPGKGQSFDLFALSWPSKQPCLSPVSQLLYFHSLRLKPTAKKIYLSRFFMTMFSTPCGFRERPCLYSKGWDMSTEINEQLVVCCKCQEQDYRSYQIWRLLISINWISSTKDMNPITRKSVSKLVTQPNFRAVGQTRGMVDISKTRK